MNAIRKQWNEAQAGGFGTPATWRMTQQQRAQQEEHEAFHALMDLIPAQIREEVIKLWVKGTESASAEAYNRRWLKSELNESDYEETQKIAHERWTEMILSA